MAIEEKENLVYWNYFIALEKDLEEISRFVEFSNKNNKTYSIRLAHLLLAASSEVDVVAKGLCGILDPGGRAENIIDYKNIIMTNIPDIPNEKVIIPRYGLTLHPWSNWRPKKNKSPKWWGGYNNVKHQRDEHFSDANLKNTLNAMAGLLVINFYYYKVKFNQKSNKEVTRVLEPNATLLSLNKKNYYDNIVG